MAGEFIPHRASDLLDTGYFYKPYVPMITTPLVFDPNTFRSYQPREEFIVRNDLYVSYEMGADYAQEVEPINTNIDWKKDGF